MLLRKTIAILLLITILLPLAACSVPQKDAENETISAPQYEEVAMGMRDAALDEINRIYTDFGSDLVKNYTVWDMPTKKFNEDYLVEYTQNTYDEHVQFIKFFLCKRFDWLDNYFNSDRKYEQLE